MVKILTGIVTSDQRDKTITVTVTDRQTHPLYGKQRTISRRYTAHDEKNEAKLGDKVTIVEVRPISKTKNFRLKNIDKKSQGTVDLKETEVEAL